MVQRILMKWCLVAVITCSLLPLATSALTLSGSVTNIDGTPIYGAIVTVKDATGLAESVYTNKKGKYRFATRLEGDLEMRFRKRYHEDVSKSVASTKNEEVSINAALPVLTDPKALSDDHPALSHFSLINFDSDEKALYSRGNFARDCLTCHQLGNSFTRWQRSAESWVPTVQRMHGYMANADEESIKQRSKMLAEAFVDGALATSKPEIPVDPMIESAKVYQWPLEGAVVPHDAEYHPGNGRIYILSLIHI